MPLRAKSPWRTPTAQADQRDRGSARAFHRTVLAAAKKLARDGVLRSHSSSHETVSSANESAMFAMLRAMLRRVARNSRASERLARRFLAGAPQLPSAKIFGRRPIRCGAILRSQIPPPSSNASLRTSAWVTMLPAGTSRVSHTFPPIVEPRPIVTRPRIVAPA